MAAWWYENQHRRKALAEPGCAAGMRSSPMLPRRGQLGRYPDGVALEERTLEDEAQEDGAEMAVLVLVRELLTSGLKAALLLALGLLAQPEVRHFAQQQLMQQPRLEQPKRLRQQL